MDRKPYAPACDRNRDPILAVLSRHLRGRRRVLEIGSGTGQHAVHFAGAMRWLEWQCSEVAANLPGIRLWLDEARLPNTPDPIELDTADVWPSQTFDAVFTANTLHILSWPEVEALFAGVGRVLRSAPGEDGHTGGAPPRGEEAHGGLLVVYGPFNEGGRFTSESNRAFDAWLKAGDPASGVRDVEAVEALARGIGMQRIDDVAMPANNRMLVWQR